MKNMGLERLCLVAPDRFPAMEATVMAAGADDVLERAQVFADVPSAVADCGLVVGTTARSRHLPWRTVEPREAAAEIAAAAATGEVAVLFGAERTGLTNEDLERCQLLLTIPTGTAYASLNVAMAVQVVAYEILLARRCTPWRRSLEAAPRLRVRARWNASTRTSRRCSRTSSSVTGRARAT